MNWLELLEPAVRHRDKRSPMYLRITDCIKGSIASGTLSEEDRLPPDRELAKLLKVDRSTIARAYDQLESEGLIYSHVGRGTFVKQRVQAPIPAKRAELSYNQIIWTDKFGKASETVSAIVQRQPSQTAPADAISFAAGSPTEEFFPSRDFQAIVGELLGSGKSAEMFGYSQPEGHPALRQEVRSYLEQQGIKASDDELLIVGGSQQAIDLVARTFIDPDNVVLMEDPTYFWAICTFAANGARCLPVATGRQGVHLDVFENVASRVDAKLFYCMPSFQNPTGSTLSIERRKRLLELSRQYQVPILEDNFVGDLSYTGKPLPSLRSLDGDGGSVIYQGTFSKALCPGLRLGWLVASEQVMSRLRLVKRTCDLSTNSLSQLILAEYLKRGLYVDHLQVVRQAYSRRLDAMCEALEKHASPWLTFDRPGGGMFIWAKLPPGYSCRELLSFAYQQGVVFSSGDVYYLSAANTEFMRLNFIQETPERINEGILRLSRALQAYSVSRKKAARQSGGYVAAEATFI